MPRERSSMGRHKFDLIVMAVCAALLGYFAWHGFEGPRGFAHQERLAAKAAKLEQNLAVLTEAREKLERKVSLMRPESVDPDMLDQLARETLDLVKPTDLVVMRRP